MIKDDEEMNNLKRALSFTAALAMTAMSIPLVSAEEDNSLSFIDPAIVNEADITTVVNTFPDDNAWDELPEASYTVATLDDIDYKLSGNNMTITKFKSSYANVEIPSSISGYTVTSIGSSAFKGNTRIRNVKLPYTVKSLGTYAFSGCTNLTSADLAEGLETIDENAFYNCSTLRSVKLPQTLTTLGRYAFQNCSVLTSITIPANTKVISYYAFAGCTSLSTVVIENGVETIGEYAFNNCDNMTSITIPKSLKKVCGYAFYNCKNLRSIDIPSNVSEIGNYAFYNCSALENVNIAEGLSYIGSYAFNKCTAIKKIKLPNSLETLSQYAFSGCKSLTGITIPGNLQTIGQYAFYECVSLSALVIEDGVEVIGYKSFSGCTSLKSLTMPESIHTMYEYAFENCTNLANIKFSSNLAVIPTYAFYNCDSLTSVYIPSTITTIGEQAFRYCDNLKYVTISEGVLKINQYAFENCKSLESINIPGSVTYVGSYAFSKCTALKSATLNYGIKEIYAHAFSECTNLVSVILPEDLNTIGNSAFNSCSSLTKITVSNGVSSIGSSAFSNCKSLTTVVIPESVTSIGSGAFSYHSSNLRIYGYPGSYAQTYANNNNIIFINISQLPVESPKITKAEAGNGQVALNWAPVNGAAQYAVYYKYNNTWYNAGTTTATGMYVRNLTNGAKYGFAVKAYVNGKWSNITNDDIVYVTPVAPVVKPKITKALGQDGRVAVNWTSVSGATNYAVYYTVGGKWYNAGTTTGTGKYVTGLTNGTTYGFAVKAYVNGAWTGIASSDIVYATPFASVTKPKITKALGQDSRVALNWTSVSGATNYAVYYTVGGKWYNAGTRTANGMYVRNLTNGTKYGFAVKAYVNGAWTSISSSDIVYATPVSAAAKPVITKAQGQNGRVALNWTAVNGATNYAVYTYLNGKWSVAGYRTATGMYVTGLTNGTTYGFAVKAYVNGAWTNITSADIVYATPTAAKSDLMDTDLDDFSFLEDNGIDFVDVAPTVR